MNDSPHVRKSLGLYMQLVVAGSHGIGGRPVPLGEIDIGADFDALLRNLEHFRAAPDELTVEQSQQWGALCLYGFARCNQIGRPCALLAEQYSPPQVKRLRQGLDIWRLKQVGGVGETLALVHEVRVSITEEVPKAGPVIEIELLPSRGRVYQARLRLTAECEWDLSETLAVKLVADPSVGLTITDARSALVRSGEIAIRISDEWEPVAFRISGRGAAGVFMVELVGVVGWEGPCPLVLAAETVGGATSFAFEVGA